MDSSPIKIFLTDDHPVFREGLRGILESESSIKVVGEAENGRKLLENLGGQEVDVLLLDIDMPECSGLEVIRPLLEKYPAINVLVFSMHDDIDYIRQMLEGGAKGYVLKSCRKEELIRAINTVGTGDSYFSSEISKKLIFASKKPPITNDKIYNSPLTKREIEVLKLVAQGLTNQEIGKKLFVSHRTIDTHRRNMMEKLDLHNAVALTNYAIKKGMIQLM